MSPRHPSHQRLQRWLDTGEPRRVERHVDECPDCQATLDELSALGDDVVADLHAATRPPDDLAARTQGGVDGRLRDEAAVGAFLDLFAVGWDVARTILDPTTVGDPAHGDDTPADQTDGGHR